MRSDMACGSTIGAAPPHSPSAVVFSLRTNRLCHRPPRLQTHQQSSSCQFVAGIWPSLLTCGRLRSAGPILASSLGCRVLDVGAPQLAMHSIREMCGTEDIAHAYEHFRAFFERFSAIDAMLSVDDLPPAAILGSIEDPPCGHVQ